MIRGSLRRVQVNRVCRCDLAVYIRGVCVVGFEFGGRRFKYICAFYVLLIPYPWICFTMLDS